MLGGGQRSRESLLTDMPAGEKEVGSRAGSEKPEPEVRGSWEETWSQPDSVQGKDGGCRQSSTGGSYFSSV